MGGWISSVTICGIVSQKPKLRRHQYYPHAEALLLCTEGGFLLSLVPGLLHIKVRGHHHGNEEM